VAERYALYFTVKPGTEEKVAELFANYARPQRSGEGGARLLGTTVFMKDNIVIRVLDVEGPLEQVMAHLSRQPAIRDLEAQLEEYLEIPRDMSTPEGARAFFGRARMRQLVHRSAD
jgi:hypothetical protein